MIDIESITNKYFDQKTLNHAYLLKTNDFDKIIYIVKRILSIGCTLDDNIENLIDEGIYQDLKIIEPDGQWIKKEQIKELQIDFKTKSVYNNKRIYIIKNAENLNKSSGNTLLKFLEEPDDNIIALLVTENQNKVLDTIVSRCQFISLDSNAEHNMINYENALALCELIEEKKQKSSVEIIKILDGYEDKNTIKELFKQIINIYDKCLAQLLGLDCSIDLNEELFDKIYKNNTIESTKIKLESLIFVVDSFDYNLNLKLLVDKLLISMFGVD